MTLQRSYWDYSNMEYDPNVLVHVVLKVQPRQETRRPRWLAPAERM